MAFAHGSKAEIYLDGLDLSPYTRSVSQSASADTAETTTLGSTAKRYLPGLRDATLSLEGLLDGAPQGQDEALAAALAAAKLYTCYPQGNSSIGDVAYGLDAIATSYEISTPVDDVQSWTAEAQSSVGSERLEALTAGKVTTTGNQPSLDNGASTPNGGVGYLHVFGSDAAVTVRVQHSEDNITYADLLVFPAVTGRGAVRETVSGQVNRYLRATESDGGTARQWAVAFGRYK